MAALRPPPVHWSRSYRLKPVLLPILKMCVQVAAPFVWSAVFEAGVRAGSPGRFYLGMAAVHAVRLAVATGAGAARARQA